MPDEKFKELLRSSGWSVIDMRSCVSETLKRDDLPVSQLLTIRADNAEEFKTWLQGIEANQGPQLKAPAPPQHTELRVALFERPDTGQVLAVMVAGEPPKDLNGQALLAYTSADSVEVAGFMLASWAMAWLSEAEVRDVIKATMGGVPGTLGGHPLH